MLILFAVRLVQPGRLGDIIQGMNRLSPIDYDFLEDKEVVGSFLQELRDKDLVCLYRGQRYMLTQAGRDIVEVSGIKLQVDERRMFLLKETRRASIMMRSSARDRSLKQ